MIKKIHIIVNPAAGNDEPILAYLNDALHTSNLAWDISLTHKDGDARKIALAQLQKNNDLIAVYGGDGTIMEVAQALYKKSVPLAILPGGTANILAKELGIPVSVQDAIALLKNSRPHLKGIDMGLCNDVPFVLRINAGVLADMVHSTKRELKNNLGQLAYGVSAVKHILNPKNVVYTIQTGKKKVAVEGVSMVVANSGNIGIPGLSLFPDVHIADGYLDVIVFKDADWQSLIQWASTVVAGTPPPQTLRHWKTKKVSIAFRPQQLLLCDDKKMRTGKISLSITRNALKVLVPEGNK